MAKDPVIKNPNAPLIQPLIIGDVTLAGAHTQTTVGAAGGASALPATPAGYLTINIGNVAYILPYYAPA